MMQEKVESRSTGQVSLKQLAAKNFMLSLLLFVVLIGIIVVASLRDRDGMTQLATVYEDQFSVEQFKAKLSNIMLPLNDFAMTGETALNFAKIKQAVSDYKASYDRIASISHLTEQNKAALNQVHNLMTGVMDTANDVANEKIPANQAAAVTLLAQNLVLAAHKKLESIVQGLELQLQQKSAEREQTSSMQLYILLGFILLIIVLLELLNRKLVKQAQTVSKVSSSVAESAGDIIQVNKMQASATDQQARFMEKVIKGLELIAESGRKISTTTASLEKNSGVIASFAKGGDLEVKDTISSMEKVRDHIHALTRQADISGQRNEQVLKSLEQIQEVADEAHLLALNASIDGAGQGASSITNDVQRMADQIREYTEEIRLTVQQASGSHDANDTDSEACVAHIEQSLDISRRTSGMLGRIESMSEKSGQAVSVLAQATARQNERNKKILQALQHISELLHISGNKLQAYSDASARLSKASESLQNMT